MKETVFYIPDASPALCCAAAHLAAHGITVTGMPCSDVTHVLLGVPAKSMPLASAVPADALFFGGNIADAPYKTVDLLRDEGYLAANASITAHCALKIAMQQLPVTLDGCETLLIGWGRISKCLAPLLKALGAKVTVATRSAAERAILAATGYGAVDTAAIIEAHYRLIINTAPAPVFDASMAADNAVLLDLASKKGISGDRVIWARGLPGKEAPESSGQLIAKTVLAYLEKERL